MRRIKYVSEKGAPEFKTLLGGANARRPCGPLQALCAEGAMSRAAFGRLLRSDPKPGATGYAENSARPSAASHEKDQTVSVGTKGGSFRERHAAEVVAPPSE